MPAPKESASNAMRRVRPWLAALLTFLGWGVGLYYAGKPALAWRWAIANVIFAALIFVSILIYLYFYGPTQNALFNSNNSFLTDLIRLGVTFMVMFGVWRYATRQPAIIERGSRVRLLGYFAVWFLPILVSVFLALAIRVAAFQPFDIPAGSMHPAVKQGDFVVATKWNYGYSQFSAAPFHEFLPQGRIFGSAPKRGDVVIFKNTKDENRDYIKRVIGLPGDEIRMRRGHLHINGQPVQKDFVALEDTVCDGRPSQVPIYRETFDTGVSYIVQECHGDNGRLDNVGPYQVPEGYVFMLGDNRDQSQDSRVISMMGYVSEESLIGKVRLNSQPNKIYTEKH